jgi:putative nucleotidyltransferase with HDIG domain
MHGNRVAMLCGSIARAMGMREEEIRELTTAGLMHDIGKIVLDEALLEQAAGPTEEQWAEIRRHPEIGYQILRGTSEFAPVANAVLSHHERIDGKGYPRGSEGDKIPVVSRILAIAEAYDEMTSDRVYRKRMDEEKAVREIRLGAGTQFDEKIARVFITKVLGRHWEDVV